jgi:hypothetical protein
LHVPTRGNELHYGSYVLVNVAPCAVKSLGNMSLKNQFEFHGGQVRARTVFRCGCRPRSAGRTTPLLPPCAGPGLPSPEKS